MLRERHVGRAVARHDHQPQVRQPAGQVVQDVDRRDVGPVQVVDEEHQRALPRDLLQERAELALHPLLRPTGARSRSSADRRRLGRSVATCTYHVGATVLMTDDSDGPSVR